MSKQYFEWLEIHPTYDIGYRPYLMPNGNIDKIKLSFCKCSPQKRKGPSGGVCWCGNAIPFDLKEKNNAANPEQFHFELHTNCTERDK